MKIPPLQFAKVRPLICMAVVEDTLITSGVLVHLTVPPSGRQQNESGT